MSNLQQKIRAIQSEVAAKNYSRAPELADLQQQLGQLKNSAHNSKIMI
jgi:hypothetical protein